MKIDGYEIMDRIKPDNENVRASNQCPLCEGEKETGLVVCWPCYRRYDLRNGNPEAENKIEEANKLERIRIEPY